MLRSLWIAPLFCLPLAQAAPHLERLAERLAQEGRAELAAEVAAELVVVRRLARVTVVAPRAR